MHRIKHFIVWLTLSCVPAILSAQTNDSAYITDGGYITLSEVVVNQKLDVDAFIKRVKEDTTFYKAFKTLRIVDYMLINDIRMLDERGDIEAGLKGKVKQTVRNSCRTMDITEQEVTGDFFDKNGSPNYYTASMYAQLFFTKGKVCNEDDIVGNIDIATDGLSGMDKRKAQLKMLFFNPGKRINGLPLISNKTEIFTKAMAKHYDMRIDAGEISGEPAYIFYIRAKPGHERNVVIKEMTTWFSGDRFDILARNYSLSYNAGVYDFDVQMRVRMSRIGELLVPSLIAYNGDWKVMTKKRERGVFTATLSNFASLTEKGGP